MNSNPVLEIGEAKGRPMLHWVGKRPLDHVTAYPAQMVERFDPLGEGQDGNLLFHGDNKDVLAWLLAHGYRGQVNLIYIDPPFDSGADYVRQVQLRGVRTSKLDGEAHGLGEQIQYTDIWGNDMYLQFVYERLLMLRELLHESGSLYFHCDWHKGHHLRCLLDEVLGTDVMQNEVIWQRTASHNDPGRYGIIHDSIYFYTKSKEYTWNDPRVPQSEEYIQAFFVYAESPEGEVIRLARGSEAPAGWRRFRLGNFASPHPRPNLMYAYKGYSPPATGWKVSLERMQELDAEGRLYFPESKEQRIQTKSYLDEVIAGKPAPDLWTDMSAIQAQSSERVDYPTQKPEGLLERIILASSNPGDLILDCFVGSGTTAAVAQKLGRRWIAADINKGAIQTTSKRLQAIVREQIEAGATPHQPALALGGNADDDATPAPAALSFSVYRVNDYDLQVQHNEAVNLAVELVGIERVKTDVFFDGVRGQQLARIVPFNHPLTPLDLQLIADELKARPGEQRDVVVVCLGKETAVDAWLDDYNKRRPVNRIDVIELRTDQKYGKFFVHQPAQAQVRIERVGERIVVEIEDFISPTIAERLEIDAPLFKTRIPDWRAMVDVVLIDAAHDGEVFDIDLSDVPERKDDLVLGSYELPAPEGPTTVAVKIVDMLGEEVLLTARV